MSTENIEKNYDMMVRFAQDPAIILTKVKKAFRLLRTAHGRKKGSIAPPDVHAQINHVATALNQNFGNLATLLYREISSPSTEDESRFLAGEARNLCSDQNTYITVEGPGGVMQRYNVEGRFTVTNYLTGEGSNNLTRQAYRMLMVTTSQYTSFQAFTFTLLCSLVCP